jgi:dihydrofolate reductase
MNIVSIIVAYDPNYLIGNDGKLPWNISNDLKYFKKLTTGNPIIMGRKTFVSIGRPLPNRHNIIVTRDKNFMQDNCSIQYTLEDAVNEAKKYGNANNCEEIFIIGGSEIFNQSINIIQRAYITEVHKKFDGDSFFQPLGNKWKEISRKYQGKEIDEIPHSFVVYEKNGD